MSFDYIIEQDSDITTLTKEAEFDIKRLQEI